MQNPEKNYCSFPSYQNVSVHKRAEVPNTHISNEFNFLNLIFQMRTLKACRLHVALGKFKLLSRLI